MVNPLLIIAGAYLLGEAYKRYVSPDQKRKWENYAKIHHGEAGAIMTGAGVLTRSPSLIASGIGFMAHDWKDSKKWFTDDKNRISY